MPDADKPACREALTQIYTYLDGELTDDEVKKALEALPEQFRMAVLLADVEGFSYKEIADILDIPIGTVMSRLHRGRKQLQKRLYDFAAERGLTPDEAPPTGDREPATRG